MGSNLSKSLRSSFIHLNFNVSFHFNTLGRVQTRNNAIRNANTVTKRFATQRKPRKRRNLIKKNFKKFQKFFKNNHFYLFFHFVHDFPILQVELRNGVFPAHHIHIGNLIRIDFQHAGERVDSFALQNNVMQQFTAAVHKQCENGRMGVGLPKHYCYNSRLLFVALLVENATVENDAQQTGRKIGRIATAQHAKTSVFTTQNLIRTRTC